MMKLTNTQAANLLEAILIPGTRITPSVASKDGELIFRGRSGIVKRCYKGYVYIEGDVIAAVVTNSDSYDVHLSSNYIELSTANHDIAIYIG